ncbi:MAG: hypothetical protein ABIR56_02675 [Polaromonas sp.]
MQKLKLHSPDLTQANIDKIAALFPGCMAEARDANGVVTRSVDFDQLRRSYLVPSWKARRSATSSTGPASGKRC